MNDLVSPCSTTNEFVAIGIKHFSSRGSISLMLWFDSWKYPARIECEPRIFAGGVQSLDVDLVLDVLDHVDVEHVDVLAWVLAAVLGGGECDFAVKFIDAVSGVLSACNAVGFVSVEMTVGCRQCSARRNTRSWEMSTKRSCNFVSVSSIWSSMVVINAAGAFERACDVVEGAGGVSWRVEVHARYVIPRKVFDQRRVIPFANGERPGTV